MWKGDSRGCFSHMKPNKKSMAQSGQYKKNLSIQTGNLKATMYNNDYILKIQKEPSILRHLHFIYPVEYHTVWPSPLCKQVKGDAYTVLLW